MSIFETEPDSFGPEALFHPDDMPMETLVLEATLGELRQPSGIVDTYKRHSDLGDVTMELSNLQAIELFERAGHGSQGVYLKRLRSGDFGVYSSRPTALQAKELAKMRDDSMIYPEDVTHSYSWQPETYY